MTWSEIYTPNAPKKPRRKPKVDAGLLVSALEMVANLGARVRELESQLAQRAVNQKPRRRSSGATEIVRSGLRSEP